MRSRAEIEKGVHVDLIVIDPDSTAHDQIAALHWFICKTESGGNVVSIRRENGIDPVPLNQESLSWDKDREILVTIMERSEVLIA